MGEPRSIATFCSTRFQLPADGVVAATDALVKWLVEELRHTTSFRVHDADDEDWGALVRVGHDRAQYQLNFAVDDGSPPGWMVEVQDPPRLFKSILARQDPAVYGRLIEAVHTLLSSVEGTRDLRWHRGSAFGRGDRSSAATVPDPVA